MPIGVLFIYITKAIPFPTFSTLAKQKHGSHTDLGKAAASGGMKLDQESQPPVKNAFIMEAESVNAGTNLSLETEHKWDSTQRNVLTW